MSFSSANLTDSQKRAVCHVTGPLLVIAGPGSGKTRVITSRIASLIESGVRPYNICAITFTNKAADEMRQRLRESGVSDNVQCSTFHSLCVRILRRYGERVGIRSNFSIYDDSDQARSMKEAIKASEVDMTNFTPRRMLSVISNFKNDLEDPESVKDRADDYFTRTAVVIYRNYQQVLANNNAMDFDDLLVQTAFLLRDCPEVRSELSKRFQYLLVDEYQDTNHAQYQIAKGLAMDHGNICVTGDPDQSIYRWRGADIENILAFEKDWPDTVVVKLEENFRSTPNILEKADQLIASNKKRKEKKLVATLPRGDDVVMEVYGDESAEAVNIAEKIRELIDTGIAPSEIAVFYRVNSMSRVIEEAFVQAQLPYQVIRGVEFYTRKEIRDMISYLKLIANSDDDMAFLRAIGTHRRGIGKTTLERIAEYAKANRLGWYGACCQASQIASIARSTQGKLAAFCHTIKSFGKYADGEVAPLIKRVFAESGLQKSLEGGGEKSQAAIENIGELINSAANYDEQVEDPSLLDYLQMIALYSDTDAYDAGSGKVSLMTLHAAKGLEFDNVFVIGVEEGILPHERSMGMGIDEIEEERRLLFVGITRARKRLQISWAQHRVVRGQFLRSVPSQFLYEIGFEYNQYDSSDSDEFFDDDVYTASEDGHGPVFRVNELVEHTKFGMGRVKEFHDMGENSIVVVRFNTGKIKSLMLAYANLTKVGS